MYGMRKTTLYLPEDLKSALERFAAARGCSTAEIIRTALRTFTEAAEPPSPRLPLFASGKPGLAEQVDEAMRGFGER